MGFAPLSPSYGLRTSADLPAIFVAPAPFAFLAAVDRDLAGIPAPTVPTPAFFATGRWLNGGPRSCRCARRHSRECPCVPDERAGSDDRERHQRHIECSHFPLP